MCQFHSNMLKSLSGTNIHKNIFFSVPVFLYARIHTRLQLCDQEDFGRRTETELLRSELNRCIEKVWKAHSPLSLWPDFMFGVYIYFFSFCSVLFLFGLWFVWGLVWFCLVSLFLWFFFFFFFFFFFSLGFVWGLVLFAFYLVFCFFLLWGTFLANVSWFPSGHVTGFIFTDGHSAESPS